MIASLRSLSIALQSQDNGPNLAHQFFTASSQNSRGSALEAAWASLGSLQEYSTIGTRLFAQ